MALLTVLATAAEGAEASELPFYVAGAVLAVFAVLISVLGFRRPAFPEGPRQARAAIGLGVLLVVATMAATVVVS